MAEDRGHFACAQCGHRQDVDADCRGCGTDVVHDIREQRTRDFLREVESRRLDRINGRIRAGSVVAGLAIVIALWFVPGYWELRRGLFALPFLVDQWVIAALIALALMKPLEARYASRPMFPFLDD